MSNFPGDKLTFAVKKNILNMKKIMEKKISSVHQKMEMKMNMNPIWVFGFDSYIFTVKQSILEMKKIMKKKIIPVHQRIEMKMKNNPVQIFGFGFDFYIMIQTKLCLNLIQSCPNLFFAYQIYSIKQLHWFKRWFRKMFNIYVIDQLIQIQISFDDESDNNAPNSLVWSNFHVWELIFVYQIYGINQLDWFKMYFEKMFNIYGINWLVQIKISSFRQWIYPKQS